jgi:hypothetical protein
MGIIWRKAADEVAASRCNTGLLYNYDETLRLEFIKEANATFLSLAYRSVLPQQPREELSRLLRKASKLESAAISGSRFSFSFMPLHNSLEEIINWLEDILGSQNISTASPYG